MSYSAPISRSNPTAFLFLIDQSGSMDETMADGVVKSTRLADVFNRTLYNLIVRCTKAEGVRDYFEIGALAYGNDGVINAFQGSLTSGIFHPISQIEANPLRVEDRKRKVDDGCGGIMEINVKFPVWLEAKHYGGTPMCEAFRYAGEALINWCQNHPNSYPPTILNITDGEANDGDPREYAEIVKQINTFDGGVIIFNLHLSSAFAQKATFPSNGDELPDKYAEMLFSMSSPLPKQCLSAAVEKGYGASEGAKGFIYNADSTDIVDFFDIGTRAIQLR